MSASFLTIVLFLAGWTAGQVCHIVDVYQEGVPVESHANSAAVRFCYTGFPFWATL